MERVGGGGGGGGVRACVCMCVEKRGVVVGGWVGGGESCQAPVASKDRTAGEVKHTKHCLPHFLWRSVLFLPYLADDVVCVLLEWAYL